MDKTYIHQLIERYFEGETSRSEEMELKQFLCSPEARDPEFDEVKAVMGFVETARAVRRPSAVYPLHGRKRIRRWVAAAGLALLLAVGGGSAGWYMYNLRAHNECVAYINGEKYTNPGVVMERMRQTMQSVLPGERETDESGGAIERFVPDFRRILGRGGGHCFRKYGRYLQKLTIIIPSQRIVVTKTNRI